MYLDCCMRGPRPRGREFSAPYPAAARASSAPLLCLPYTYAIKTTIFNLNFPAKNRTAGEDTTPCVSRQNSDNKDDI